MSSTLKDKKITFFLGSGFSKSIADIPIQADFLTSVLNKERKGWIIDPVVIDKG